MIYNLTKIVALLFTILFSCNISAQINRRTTYVINKKPIQVLQFINDKNYVVIEYVKDKGNIVPNKLIDSGIYRIHRWFIKFNSKYSKPIINGKNLFLDKNLSKNFWNPYQVFTRSDTNRFHSVNWVPPIINNIDTKPKTINIDIPFYTKKFYETTIHRYASIYDSLMLTNFAGPGDYSRYVNGKFVEYRGDTTVNYLMDDYTTVVHESTHGFNHIIGRINSNNLYKIMIEPGLTIYYNSTKTFESSIIRKIVPANANNSIFRYNSYVGLGSNFSSNLSGIYGLMDEFSAYRNGCHAGIISHLKATELNHTQNAKIFISEANKTYFAYYEFRLFIAWYLAYAKKYNESIYKELLDNKNLRIAFTLLDELFKEDVRLLGELNHNLNNRDFNYIEDKYVRYLKQITPEWESYLFDFKIHDINMKNWKENIKPIDKSLIKYYITSN